MNNNALVAALGMDAVAAVHSYRQQVISEAERRGLRLVSDALSDLAHVTTGIRVVDPVDIRLTFLRVADLAGFMLIWCPAQGWSLSRAGRAFQPATSRRRSLSPRDSGRSVLWTYGSFG